MADLYKVTCVSCGVEFGLSDGHHAVLKAKNTTYYCPNGHGQFFTKHTSELEELRAEVKTLKEQAAKDKATIEELTREVEIWRPASAEPPKTGT